MFEHFSTAFFIFVLYFTVMTALIFCFTVNYRWLLLQNIVVIVGSKTAAHLAMAAMAQQGTKRPLEDAVLPILTRSKLEFEIGVRFVVKGLPRKRLKRFSLGISFWIVCSVRKNEKDPMDLILLRSSWILVDGVPHYRVYFLSGKSREHLGNGYTLCFFTLLCADIFTNDVFRLV